MVFNPLIAWLLRSPLHGFLSRNTMLITVRGRKSGRLVTTPVNYVRANGDLLSVSLRSRTWWRNLRGGAPVEVCLAGQDRRGQARVSETQTEVEAGLTDLVVAAPAFARPLNISLRDGGRPVEDDLARAATDRVIVRTRLED